MEYIIEGSGTLEIDEVVFHPSAGDVYLLPIGSRHHYYAAKDSPFKKIWINAGGELCNTLIGAYGLSGKHFFPKSELYPLFLKLLSVCESGGGEEVHRRCALVFHEIISALASRGVSGGSYSSSGAISEAVLRAKQFCDRNMYNKITAEDTAQATGLSLSQLNRIFRKETGKTVYAYILDGKINTAKALLGGTSMRVNEIAYMLKFTDEHYFTNIFKKKTGTTPSDWRAEH